MDNQKPSALSIVNLLIGMVIGTIVFAPLIIRYYGGRPLEDLNNGAVYKIVGICQTADNPKESLISTRKLQDHNFVVAKSTDPNTRVYRVATESVAKFKGKKLPLEVKVTRIGGSVYFTKTDQLFLDGSN
jgi:hypothetical protein